MPPSRAVGTANDRSAPDPRTGTPTTRPWY